MPDAIITIQARPFPVLTTHRVIDHITEYDPDTAPERPLKETDAAKLYEGIDLRDHMTSTSPERFADLLLS